MIIPSHITIILIITHISTSLYLQCYRYDYDPDKSYALTAQTGEQEGGTYTYTAPVQMPINPAYATYLENKKKA